MFHSYSIDTPSKKSSSHDIPSRCPYLLWIVHPYPIHVAPWPFLSVALRPRLRLDIGSPWHQDHNDARFWKAQKRLGPTSETCWLGITRGTKKHPCYWGKHIKEMAPTQNQQNIQKKTLGIPQMGDEEIIRNWRVQWENKLQKLVDIILKLWNKHIDYPPKEDWRNMLKLEVDGCHIQIAETLPTRNQRFPVCSTCIKSIGIVILVPTSAADTSAMKWFCSKSL